MSQQTEAAIRRAGALAALPAASALLLLLFAFPAAVQRGQLPMLLLPLPLLFVTWLAGCAAILVSPAHRAVADLARGLKLRWVWVGFACAVLCTAHVVVAQGHAREAAAAVDKVIGFLIFLAFLAGVWMVNLSMLTATGYGPPPPPAEQRLGAGGFNAMQMPLD